MGAADPVVDEPAELSPWSLRARAIWLWGVGGTCALLVDALYRLSGFTIEAIEMSLSPSQWALMIGWCVVMAYAEGYRGFQLRFSPRVVARSRWLAGCGRPGLQLCAPLVAMGLMHATRRRLVATWVLILGIVGLVLLIRELDQPWRGIVDAGVVVGLSWGLLATLWHAARDLGGDVLKISLDLPENEVEGSSSVESRRI